MIKEYGKVKPRKPLRTYRELSREGVLPYGEAAYDFERRLNKHAKMTGRLIEASLRRQNER